MLRPGSSQPRNPKPLTPARIVRGLARLAMFHADGIPTFDAGLSGVIASIVPWGVLVFVSGTLAVMSPMDGVSSGDVMTLLLALVIGIVFPLVASEWLATRWGRSAEWPRYATAYNCIQWLLPVLLVAVAVVVEGLVAQGLPLRLTVWAGAGILSIYTLSLNWFVARQALATSPARAALLVIVVQGGMALILFLPGLLRMTMIAGRS